MDWITASVFTAGLNLRAQDELDVAQIWNTGLLIVTLHMIW